jgi:hypothetical protein
MGVLPQANQSLPSLDTKGGFSLCSFSSKGTGIGAKQAPIQIWLQFCST